MTRGFSQIHGGDLFGWGGLETRESFPNFNKLGEPSLSSREETGPDSAAPATGRSGGTAVLKIDERLNDARPQQRYHLFVQRSSRSRDFRTPAGLTEGPRTIRNPIHAWTKSLLEPLAAECWSLGL